MYFNVLEVKMLRWICRDIMGRKSDWRDGSDRGGLPLVDINSSQDGNRRLNFERGSADNADRTGAGDGVFAAVCFEEDFGGVSDGLDRECQAVVCGECELWGGISIERAWDFASGRLR